MPPIAVRTAAPDWVVEAEAVRIGPDVLVWIYGGEKPHIGAVAAALARADEIRVFQSTLIYKPPITTPSRARMPMKICSAITMPTCLSTSP